jgi:predicted CopG family antitoxin
MEMKMVAVSEETHKRLADRGKWGESMDDLIKELLDKAEKREK